MILILVEKFLKKIIFKKFFFLSNCVFQNRYSGCINGKNLNNKHNFYVKLVIYRKTYIYILNSYLKNDKYNKLKFLSIDSTFINNKIKISTIVDINGIPLSLLLIKGSINDSKTLISTFNNLFLDINI